MNTQRRPATEDDLRPVIARLQDLRRRCLGMGTRNEEFPDMALRLEKLIQTLSTGEDEHGAPVSYRAVASQLFPIARLFESVGFLSVGREIAHVERTLCELQSSSTDDPAPPQQPADLADPAVAVAPESRGTLGSQGWQADDTESRPVRDRLKPTLPITVTAVVGLAVITVMAWVVVRQDRHQAAPSPVLPTVAIAAPTMTPPPPTRVSETPDQRNERLRRTQLYEIVSAARIALQAGDLDGALRHLDEASRIDVTPGLVVETATSARDLVLQRAQAAADATHWHDADAELDLARTLTRRFGLDITPLTEIENHIASLPHFRRYGSDDGARLAAEAGHRVEIFTNSGAVLEGTLRTADRLHLVLHRADELKRGSGAIVYDHEVAMDSVQEVRVYDP